jgi:hypothetical protein
MSGIFKDIKDLDTPLILIGLCPILVDYALSELLEVKMCLSKHQRPERALSIRIGQSPING